MRKANEKKMQMRPESPYEEKKARYSLKQSKMHSKFMKKKQNKK